VDARWIAELLAHDLIRPSFIPPPPIQALRELTRTRVGLIQTRTQAKNRVTKVLEDTNIKVASVVADLFGVSGRRMLAALIAGERNPQVLANLAVRRLRRKLPELELALTGQCTEFHARLIQLSLELIDLPVQQIAILDQQIGALVAPLTPQIEQLTSLPGVEATAARADLREDGHRCRGADAWDLHEQGKQLLIGSESLLDVDRERVDLALQEIDDVEQLTQQEAMGGLHATREGLT